MVQRYSQDWCVDIFLKRLELYGVKLSCPETFKDGVNTIVCQINQTAVKEADCSSVQSFVTFEWTKTSTATKCYTQSFNSSKCSHIQEAGANPCWCNKSDGEIFDYIFPYQASYTQDVGAQLGCKVCPSPNNHFDEEISDNCKNLHFEVSSDKGSLSGRDSQHQPANSRAADPVVATFLLIMIIFLACIIC